MAFAGGQQQKSLQQRALEADAERRKNGVKAPEKPIPKSIAKEVQKTADKQKPTSTREPEPRREKRPILAKNQAYVKVAGKSRVVTFDGDKAPSDQDIADARLYYLEKDYPEKFKQYQELRKNKEHGKAIALLEKGKVSPDEDTTYTKAQQVLSQGMEAVTNTAHAVSKAAPFLESGRKAVSGAIDKTLGATGFVGNKIGDVVASGVDKVTGTDYGTQYKNTIRGLARGATNPAEWSATQVLTDPGRHIDTINSQLDSGDELGFVGSITGPAADVLGLASGVKTKVPLTKGTDLLPKFTPTADVHYPTSPDLNLLDIAKNARQPARFNPSVDPHYPPTQDVNLVGMAKGEKPIKKPLTEGTDLQPTIIGKPGTPIIHDPGKPVVENATPNLDSRGLLPYGEELVKHRGILHERQANTLAGKLDQNGNPITPQQLSDQQISDLLIQSKSRGIESRNAGQAAAEATHAHNIDLLSKEAERRGIDIEDKGTPSIRANFESQVVEPEVPTNNVQNLSATATTPPVKHEPGSLMATANRVTNEVRTQIGLEGKKPVAPEKVSQWATEAQGIDADALIQEIAKKPRPLSKAEELAMAANLSRTMGEYDNALTAFRDAADRGAVSQAHVDALDAAKLKVDEVITAAEKAGTEWGRSGVARQALIRSDYSTEGLLLRAKKKALKTNTEIDPATSARIQEDAARIKDYETRIAELEDQVANQSPPKRTRSEAARAARKERLDTDYNSIVQQIKAMAEKPEKATSMGRNRQRGAIDLGPKAKLIGLYGELGWNFAQRGMLKFEEIFAEVTKVASEAGHKISKQELIDAMDNTRQQMRLRRAKGAIKEDVKARRDLTRQIEKGSTRAQERAQRRAEQASQRRLAREADLAEAKKLNDNRRAQRQAAAAERRAETQAEKARYAAERRQLKLEEEDIRRGYRESELAKNKELEVNRRAQKEAQAKADRAESIAEKKKYQAERRQLRSEEQDIIRNLRETGGLARQAAADARRSTQADYQEMFGPLVRDENSLARMDGQIKDLEMMLKTGDYYGTGRTHKASTLEDAVELKKYQLGELKKQVDMHIDDIGKPTLVKVLNEVSGIPRFLQLGLDAGAMFRQGLDILYTNPKAWFKANIEGGKAAFNKQYAARLEREFMNDIEVIKAKKNGLEIDGAGEHPEYFVSRTLQKVPGYAAGERFHKTFQNVARYESYKSVIKNGRLNDLQKGEVAKLINAMTGRGNWIKGDSKILQVFTAPRMYAGQLETMTAGINIRKMATNAGYRNLVIKRTAARLGVLAGLYEVAQANGWDFSLNPEDSDFLKLRKGNVVYDVGGGYTPYYRLITRTLNDLASEGSSPQVFKRTVDMGQYKIAPAIRTLIGATTGKNAVGEPYFSDKRGNRTLADAESWISTFAPLIGQEIYSMAATEKYGKAPIAEKGVAAGYSFVGGGVQAYPKKRASGFQSTYLGQLVEAAGLKTP